MRGFSAGFSAGGVFPLSILHEWTHFFPIGKADRNKKATSFIEASSGDQRVVVGICRKLVSALIEAFANQQRHLGALQM